MRRVNTEHHPLKNTGWVVSNVSRFPNPQNPEFRGLPKALSQGIIDKEKRGFSLRKNAQVEMSIKIRILSKNVEVRRHLKRIIGLNPAWKTVGKMDVDKAIAGSPLKRPPNVVIAEMSRLDADMISLIAAIRIKFGGSKILAVSSQRDSRLVLRVIHAGANGFMISDRASEELTAAIKTVAAGGLYLSPGIAGLAGRRPS
jgi:hypothetical protein